MKILYLAIAALCMTSYCASAQETGKTNKKDTVIALKEVVVKAKKRLIKYEAGQYTVDATLLRKGKINLVDLLSSVPGIIVTDKDIKILGRNDLKVMFNGRIKRIPKDELIGILKSYEASNVKKIEVIKDPGAKYEAEGNYGILNIITEKKDNYIGGELSDEILYCQKWKNASRLNLNYNYKRFTSSFNAGWTYGKTRYTESGNSYFTGLTRKSSSSYAPKANDYNLTGSIDYMIDSLSTVSLEASYIDAYTKEMGTNEEKSYSTADAFLGKSHSLSSSATPRKNLNMSFYIDRNWHNYNKISLIMDLFRYRNDKNYLFNSRYYNNDNMPNDSTDYLADTSKAHLNGFSSALDYEGLLPWNIKFMTGAKAAFSKTDDNLHYDYSTLPVQNDIFSYTENVYAGYAILKKSFGQFSMDADFFAFSGHKVYGPTGIGVLYGKENWLDRLPPYQGGGEMIQSVSFEKTIFEKLPFKFEAGTPDYIGTNGLGKAIDYISALGMENIAAYEHELTQYATQRMKEIPGML